MYPTPHDVIVTSLRWLMGLTLAGLVGVVVSTLSAMRRVDGSEAALSRGSRVLVIAIDFLRALPVIALMPLVQTFGVTEPYKIGLIAWAALFPIVIAIRKAILEPMMDLELVLRGAQLDWWSTIRTYTLPKALAGLRHGIEVSIGVAWIAVVVGEMLGNFSTGFWSGGLGHHVKEAYEANHRPGMLASLAIFGVLGCATSWGWRWWIGPLRTEPSLAEPARPSAT